MVKKLFSLLPLRATSFSTDKLKTRFVVVSIFGATVLAALALVGFLIQSYALQQQESLQVFHSIISRQIGIVQKMSLLAEELKGDLDTRKRSELIRRFRQNFSDLKETKQKLRDWAQGYQSLSVAQTGQLLRTSGLEEQIETYLATAETITETGPYSPEAVRAQTERFTHRVRTDLVDVLNNILSQIVNEANKKADLLKWTSYSIVALILLSAMLLWVFVFNPMFKTILAQQESMVDAVFRAEAASRSKTEFLANISHEIRTPMTAILGYAEVLEAKSETKPEVRQAFEVIKTNANHLMRLIDDILDVSKIEAGGVEVSSEKVDLKQLILEVQALLKVKAEQKGIYLKFSSKGLVPQHFHSDPVRLKQILFNIIGNAIKFTDKGGVRILVSYQENATGGALQFLIKDSGCGIPPNQLRRLFKPFVQADTTSRRHHGGTGLGLVLSKRLAIMLGGDVEVVETVENEGTTFSVTLQPEKLGPLVALEFSETQVFEQPKRNNGDALLNDRLEGTKILVVDDAIENCNLFKLYLEKAQAQVDVAYSGEEALKRTSEKDFDLIFLDLQMPGKDGFEVLKELRNRSFDKPIIALTAHAMPEERQKTLSFGFNEHVSKPVSAATLVSTVVRFI